MISFLLEKILIPFMSGKINHDLTSCPETIDLRTRQYDLTT